MSIIQSEVYVFIFDLSKKSSTNELVKVAAREYYLRKNGTAFGEKKLSDELFEVGHTGLGKPYFPNCREIFFSVSHSGEYLVCAVANENVGVDIEKTSDDTDKRFGDLKSRLIRIASRFFHPDEASIVKTDPIPRFYEVFTAKESYVKFTGSGFDETLSEHSVLPEHREMPSCHSVGEASWHADGVEFHQLVFKDDYTLCICTENQSALQIVYVDDDTLQDVFKLHYNI